MLLRLRCSALLLMLCLGWAGCSPVAETQLDEQKNPHYQAGKQRASALDYKGAIESFERATEDNPRSALAHYELGVLFERENDYAAALYHYNKAVKLRPNGYPADNIRMRIPACKQELVKADSLAVINPSALRETEQLREENVALRKQVEMLQSHLAARPPAASPVNAGASASVGVTRPASVPSSSGSASMTRPVPGATGSAAGSSAPDRTRSTVAAGRFRSHSVKPGDTPSSIARQYQIKLNSLLSANPGLDPKRMRVGQVVYIPAS